MGFDLEVSKIVRHLHDCAFN